MCICSVAADCGQLRSAVTSCAGTGDAQVSAQGAKRHSAEDGDRGAKRQRLQSELHVLPRGVTSLHLCSGSEFFCKALGGSSATAQGLSACTGCLSCAATGHLRRPEIGALQCSPCPALLSTPNGSLWAPGTRCLSAVPCTDALCM